jgi:hypothetical protein
LAKSERRRLQTNPRGTASWPAFSWWVMLLLLLLLLVMILRHIRRI